MNDILDDIMLLCEKSTVSLEGSGIKSVNKGRSSSEFSVVGFTARQVRDLTGLSARQLRYFEQTQLVVPGVRPAGGKGRLRLYSFRDLVVLRVIARFRASGISLQVIRKAVAYLKTMAPDGLAAVVLAIHGDDIVVVTRDQTVVSLVKNPEQLYFVIDVGGITQALSETIAYVS